MTTPASEQLARDRKVSVNPTRSRLAAWTSLAANAGTRAWTADANVSWPLARSEILNNTQLGLRSNKGFACPQASLRPCSCSSSGDPVAERSTNTTLSFLCLLPANYPAPHHASKLL
uniref:Uncharacterized protein n=1 Tax=Mycena chlorophos TaxID=658473 RepID=A0ABQ0L4B8_MYCCL|nr:predicted protein [Mycena chlorophos]